MSRARPGWILTGCCTALLAGQSALGPPASAQASTSTPPAAAQRDDDRDDDEPRTAAAQRDDDEPPTAAAQRDDGPPVELTAEQQRAVGIATLHPARMQMPERIAAIGVVLDPSLLVSESAELAAAEAADHAAGGELARLRTLHDAGAGASLKMLEAAQAERARSQALALSARAQFALHWGPLAAQPAAARARAIATAAHGRGVLVRAELPGRHALGVVPRRAVLEVDGIEVPGRVLGVLRSGGDTQGVGLLVAVDQAPAGLGVGVRCPLLLLTAARAGRLVPQDAVFYDEHGAYVYAQAPAQAVPAHGAPAAASTRYRIARVTLLFAAGPGWLVDGLEDRDEVVVRGAGALWSLQEMAGHAAAADDD